MISRTVPYSDCTRDNPLAHTILEMGYSQHELAVAVASEGLRPTMAANIPVEVELLLKLGWSSDCSQRPSAAQLAQALLQLAHKFEDAYDDDVEDIYLALSKQIPLDQSSMEDLKHLLEVPQLPCWIKARTQEHRIVPVGTFASEGIRGKENMEDRSAILQNPFGSSDVLICGVFDGHRGSEASEFFSSHLERLVHRHWSASSGADALLHEVFLSAEDEFEKSWKLEDQESISKSFPGTTALCAVLHGNILTIANVGDSRAILCRDGKPTRLSLDQTLDRNDERERVIELGGQVFQHDGGWRLKPVGLAVSRSIGDFDMKQVGVICAPEIQSIQIDPQRDSFVILATDGVWDVLPDDDALRIVQETVKQPAMCAQRIVTEALTRGSEDNATALVIFLPGGHGALVGSAERVFRQGDTLDRGEAI